MATKGSKKIKNYSDNRLTLGRLASMLLLFVGVILILIPLLWTVCMAIKPNSEQYLSNFFPHTLAWDNFAKATKAIPFWHYFENTVKIVVPVMIGVVGTSAITAYGFSRFNFKFKNIWFVILLATMMIPGQILMIPQYLMFRAFHWTNSLLPLIIPAFFGGGAFNIFLLRQFMSGIPMTLDEAATLDGANKFTIFWRVIIPLSKPALMAVTLFTFMGVWNDYQGPLIYLNDSTKYTLTLALSMFKGQYVSQVNYLMAATLLVMLPTLILLFVAQKQIIEGIAISSGTKG